MEWIDVNDRLPENNSDVLVYDSDYNTVYSANYNSKYFNQTGFWLNEAGGEYQYEFEYVTHWMPLPEPPKQ